MCVCVCVCVCVCACVNEEYLMYSTGGYRTLITGCAVNRYHEYTCTTDSGTHPLKPV